MISLETLSQLDELSSRLWGIHDIHKGLHEILDASMKMMSSDLGYMQLFEESSGMLSIVAQRGFSQSFLGRFRQVSPMDGSACGRAMLSRDLVHIEDVETDEAFAPFREILNAARFSSVTSIPVIGQDERVLGVISTHYQYPRVLSEADIYQFRRYAGRAAEFIDRCRTEEASRLRDQRFGLAAKAIGVGVWFLDRDGATIELTDICQNHLASPKRMDLDLTEFLSLVCLEDRFETKESILRALNEGRDLSTSFRIADSEEIPRWISTMGRCIRDADNRVIGLMGITIDMTENKIREERLVESEQRFRGLFEQLPIAYQSLDVNGQWIDANQKLADLFGYAYPSEVIGKSIVDHWDCSIRDQFETVFENFRRDREVDGVLPMLKVDGSPIMVQVSGRVERDTKGHFLRTHCILVDVTEQEEKQQQILAQNLELERQVALRTVELKNALTAKTEFLANMSHEIRNPLNNINILTHLLSKTCSSCDEKVSGYISRIGSSVQGLSRLVDDVLDFSKIDAGQLVFEVAPFSLQNLLDRLKLAHDITAKNKGLTIQWPDSLPDGLIFGDSLRLEQVLGNLLGNAIKFTEAGSICLTIRTLSQGNEFITLHFDVVDSGIGISQDAIPHLLEPFTQADSSITRRFGGTGLGLSICDRLIRLMGGSLNIKSTPGMGSSFFFDLTFKRYGDRREEDCDPGSKASRLDGLTLLLVDDDERMLQSLADLLVSEGAGIQMVHNGRDACEWLRANGASCDVVLMDIQMPVMDGITATQLIRSELGLKDLPIIALTAGILRNQQQLALDAGITEMLRKPVEPGQLIERLSSITRSPKKTAP